MADIAADDGAAEETILTSHKRTIPMMATELAVGEEDRWDLGSAITTTPRRSAGLINYKEGR